MGNLSLRIGALIQSIIIVCCLAFSSGMAGSDEAANIRIVMESDKFQIIIMDAQGHTELLTYKPEDIEFGQGEIRISDKIVINEEGMFVNGRQVDRDKLESITLEKDADSNWRMKIKSYVARYVGGKGTITYTKSLLDKWELSGNLLIDDRELVEGNAVALIGDVEVYGKVKGDVVSVFGNVFLDSTAIVGGNVIAVTGDIEVNEGAEVDGDRHAGASFTEEPKIRLDKDRRFGFGFELKYNRVTGMDIIEGLNFEDKSHQIPDLHARTGYAMAMKRWHYDLGFEQQLFNRYALDFGGNIYRLFDNSDRWVIGDEENSLAAFFLKEDYWDLFEREGLGFWAQQWFGFSSKLKLEYRADDYTLLKKNSDWAMFGGKKHFRENYSFALPDSGLLKGLSGEMRSMMIGVELDTRQRDFSPYSGWYVDLENEIAGYGLGGDFRFKRWSATLQRLQPLTDRQYLNMRVVGGFSADPLPLQKQFFIGGIGTLRGFDYKQFGGDRMLLANMEYTIDFEEYLTGILFYDVGKAAYGGDAFENEDFHSDLGIAFQSGDFIRIDFAEPIDEPEDDLKVTIRTKVSF